MSSPETVRIQVPLSANKKSRNFSALNDEQLVAFCHQEYPNIKLNELFAKDLNLALALRRRGLGHHFVNEPREYTSWKSLSNDELKVYYLKNHNGRSCHEVRKAEPNFWAVLSKRKLLVHLPDKNRRAGRKSKNIELWSYDA